MHQFGQKVPEPPTPPPIRIIREGIGTCDHNHNHGNEHFHKAPDGTLIKCYHQCKSLLTDWKFILGVTISFPIEHFLWEKVWPFTVLTKFLGL